MKRFLLLLFAFALYAADGDTLEYDSNVEGLADGDTFKADLHYHAMKDSIQSIINGRLGDDNLASDANIDLSKIDSTGTDADDWVYHYTKKWQVANAKRQLRSWRGMAVYINDTTANGDTLHIISDSTDTVAGFYEDSVLLYEPVRADSTKMTYLYVTDSATIGDLNADTITATKYETYASGWYTDLYLMDQNLRTTDGPTFANLNTGHGTNELFGMDQSVKTTDTVTFDSITISSGITCTWVNTGEGASEVYAMDQDVQTTDAVDFATVNTGHGANELYAMNQDMETTDAVQFATVNTGHGANELYAMNQDVETTDDVTFDSLEATCTETQFIRFTGHDVELSSGNLAYDGQSYISVGSENGASSLDTLSNLTSYTYGVSYPVLILKAAPGDQIYIADSDPLKLSAAITLDSEFDCLVLLYNYGVTTNRWIEISRSDNQ